MYELYSRYSRTSSRFVYGKVAMIIRFNMALCPHKHLQGLEVLDQKQPLPTYFSYYFSLNKNLRYV